MNYFSEVYMNKKHLSSKIFFTSLMLAAAIGLCLTGCSSAKLSKEEISRLIGGDGTPIETIDGTYSVDVTDFKQVVGDSDYVIVAEVKDYVDTSYSVTGLPLTEYSVQVVENIKGKLDTTTEIDLIKEGGLNKKHSAFIVYENDFLPQIGKTYIFCLYGQSSGAIRACGQNYTLKIENSSDYQNERNYLDILDAYENEIVSERTRYKSQYEVN